MKLLTWLKRKFNTDDASAPPFESVDYSDIYSGYGNEDIIFGPPDAVQLSDFVDAYATTYSEICPDGLYRGLSGTVQLLLELVDTDYVYCGYIGVKQVQQPDGTHYYKTRTFFSKDEIKNKGTSFTKRDLKELQRSLYIRKV